MWPEIHAGFSDSNLHAPEKSSALFLISLDDRLRYKVYYKLHRQTINAKARQRLIRSGVDSRKEMGFKLSP